MIAPKDHHLPRRHPAASRLQQGVAEAAFCTNEPAVPASYAGPIVRTHWVREEVFQTRPWQNTQRHYLERLSDSTEGLNANRGVRRQSLQSKIL